MKLFITFVCPLFFCSCICNLMYGSLPYYKTDDSWNKLIHNDERHFVLVSPKAKGIVDDPLIKDVARILNDNGTFYCFLCRGTASFSYENIDMDELDTIVFIQKQYAYKKSQTDFYRDWRDEVPFDSSDKNKYFMRDDSIHFFKIKEEKYFLKEKKFYVIFNDYSFVKSDHVYFDGRFSIWNYENNRPYVRGRLGPISGSDEKSVAKTIADYLSIELDL